jgi:hypothetical protein
MVAMLRKNKNSKQSMKRMLFSRIPAKKLVMTNLALLMEVDDLVEWVDLILAISMLRIFFHPFLEIWDDLVVSNKPEGMKVGRIYNMT